MPTDVKKSFGSHQKFKLQKKLAATLKNQSTPFVLVEHTHRELCGLALQGRKCIALTPQNQSKQIN